MTALEILRKADALLATEACWTRDEFAKNAHGRRVSVGSDLAACFCVHGAIARAAGVRDPEMPLNEGRVATRYLKQAVGLRTHLDLANWNDAPSRAFGEIKSAFAKAIALAEAEEKQNATKEPA